jgi:hypothetical protein
VTGKEDLFTPIHKGLRSMLYGLSERLQTSDFADISAVNALMKDLEDDFAIAQSAGCVLCHFATHAHEEDVGIFPGAAKFANELVSALIEDHHRLTQRELEIAKSTHELLQLPTPEARIQAGIRLNQMANQLFADYIAHMNREEEELVPLMKENLTDAEQAAIRGAIIARFPPDRFFALLGWMLPSLNVNELSELLASVKQGAPPPVMKAITDLAAAKVDAVRWTEVKHRTGI